MANKQTIDIVIQEHRRAGYHLIGCFLHQNRVPLRASAAPHQTEDPVVCVCLRPVIQRHDQNAASFSPNRNQTAVMSVFPGVGNQL